MSEWRERYEESPALANALEWTADYYQYLIGAVVLLFMLFVRLRTWGNFIVNGEVLYSSNDPWYHFRNTMYSVENWPSTMPFDPWTYFPYGNASGQFGTFFDQLMATVAMIVGLGNPSEELVALVVLFVPPLMGVLIAVPTYIMGRRIGGRFGGIVALVVLALSAGRLLGASLVGTSDHHVAEAFFQATAVLGVMVAVAAAQRDKPIYEQFSERAIDPLRSTIGWSILAGFAITLYLWVWPPGVLLIAVLGVYFLLQLTVEFVRGESPEHTAIAGAIIMTTTGVLVLAGFDVFDITATEFSLLQPLFAFLVAFGCVFMAWLARVWESRDRARWEYPVAVFGIIAAVLVAFRLVAPDMFAFFVDQARRVIGFTTTPTAGTVGEAAPISFDQAGIFFDWHGFAILIAWGAALWIVGKTVLGRKVRPEALLLVVLLVFMQAAAFTQQRFDYYLVVPMAVLTGYAVGGLFRRFDLRFDASSFELYKALSVVAVVLILVVPMAVGSTTAMTESEFNGPGADIQGWTDSLEWMQDNTPEEGLYDDDTQELEYYGTYPRTEDFDYEPGSYGVLSWWDYGHWITLQGERIPNANPHQQGSREAANFLIAPNETQANDVIGEMAENDSETRYVMADWKMVNTYSRPIVQNQQRRINGKFFAPITFYDQGDVATDDYWDTLYFEQTTQQGPMLQTFNYHKQPYYDAMVTRLYKFHGSAVEPQPVVLDWEGQESEVLGRTVPMTWTGSPQLSIREFDSMAAAREYVADDSTAQIGGFGGNPSERVEALENYRFVGSSEINAMQSQSYQLGEQLTSLGAGVNRSAAGYYDDPSEPWTKVFERVPGATIEGTAPANTNVTGFVQLRNPASNETFTYHQRAETDANGEFTMTVPYSTTGYDEWGTEEGRTNVSVRATGAYDFRAVGDDGGNATLWQGEADVPESAVIGESDEPVSVDLEQVDVSVNGDDGAVNESESN